MTTPDPTADTGLIAAESAILEWARAQLDSPVEVEPIKSRPWGRTWRLRGAAGISFVKATGAASRYEAPLTAAVSRVAPDLMASVLAVEPAAGWILLADAGPTLTERLDGRFESGLWERMLVDFAQLQRRSEPLTAELLAAGVPDERPDRLFAVLNQLLLQSPGLTDLTDAERRTLLGQPERWAEAAAELAQLPIAASVQHGDLHGGNLAIGDDGKARFFDLGDASIAHPFTTMLVPLQVARSLHADDGQLDRLRDSYLEVFTDLATPVQLRRGLDLALRSAALPKATAWDRALRFATAGHPWGEPVLEYVRDLL